MKISHVFAIALLALAASFTRADGAAIPPLTAAQSSYSSNSLHVDVYGTSGKPNVILIPGLTCGPWEFSNEIAALQDSYRIYALTLPGFDGQRAIDGPLFSTVSKDFWTWIDRNKIDKPILIGHSLGGTLSEMLATQHPEKLRAMVAIDGLPIFPGNETLTQAQREVSAAKIASKMENTPQSQYETVLKTYTMPYMVTAKADADADAVLEAKSDARAAAQWMKEDLLLDLRQALSSVNLPFLVIAPYDATLESAIFKNADIKRAYYASLLKNAPHAQVVIVENSRHFIMNDQPRALDAAIAQFLAALPTRS